MKIKYLLISGLLLLSPFFACATSDHLVISQVQISGDGGAGDEFVEIYNPTDLPVDLSGWSIQYKSATGSLPLTSGKKNLPAASLPPGGYYLVANGGYNGAISADLTHSSFSLSGSATGATVFLSKDTSYVQSCSDTFVVDRLAYGTGAANCPEGASALLPASEQSLSRANPADDSDNNAADFLVNPSAPHNLSETPAPPSDPPLEPGKKAAATPYTQSLVISEFLPNPEGADSGEEWVEIFNPSNEIVELAGWKLDDKALAEDKVGVTAFAFPKEAKIMPNAFYTVQLGEQNFGISNFGGDELRLIWPDDAVACRVAFEADAPEEQSYARRLDGSYAWTLTPTKNAANLIEDDKPLNPSVLGIAIPNGEVFVRVIEALPNPKGADSGKEWVKLFNAGEFPLNLAGWILDDGKVEDKIGSSAYTLDPLGLDPGQKATLTIPPGKFALNNTGEDHIRLFNPQKVLISEVGFLEAKEGKILNFALPGQPQSEVSEIRPYEVAPIVAAPVVSASPAIAQAGEGGVAGARTLPRTGADPALYIRIFVIFGLVWYIFRCSHNLYQRSVSVSRV